MSVICTIIQDILAFIAGYYFYRCVCCFLKPRKHILFFLLQWTVMSMVVSIVIYPNDMVNITISLLLFLATNLFLFEGRLSIKISTAIVLYPIATTLNFFHMDAGARLYFSFFSEKEDRIGSEIAVTVTYAFIVLFWIFFYRVLAPSMRKMKDTLDNKAWIMVTIIGLASFTAIFSCTYFAPPQSYYVWPCLIACLITNMGCIYLSSSYMAEGIYAQMERAHLRLQQNYYEELDQNQKQIRRLRHDLNSQLGVAGSLLAEGKVEEAKAYFAHLSSYVKAGSRRFCKNSLVNAVLNARYDVILEEKIDEFFNIDIDGILSIDDVSLCTIFANTLDNAIEACRKLPEESRKISVKARYSENRYFSYEIANTKCNRIETKNGRFLSDKGDSSLHGMGLYSVKEIVARYEGFIDISYTDTEFKVVILIEQ